MINVKKQITLHSNQCIFFTLFHACQINHRDGNTTPTIMKISIIKPIRTDQPSKVGKIHSLRTCWIILRLLWPAARSSRLTIFLILVCISRTSLNWTSDWRSARVISLRQSFKTFSSMIVALLICWRAREMLPPNCASTIFTNSW